MTFKVCNLHENNKRKWFLNNICLLSLLCKEKFKINQNKPVLELFIFYLDSPSPLLQVWWPSRIAIYCLKVEQNRPSSLNLLLPHLFEFLNPYFSEFQGTVDSTWLRFAVFGSAPSVEEGIVFKHSQTMQHLRKEMSTPSCPYTHPAYWSHSERMCSNPLDRK